MQSLNYHHLHYFWSVAHAGSVARAAARLRVGSPTVSAQVKLLEEAVGSPLFEREGRLLALTPMGRTVLRYADEIFRVGNELKAAVATGSASAPLLLRAGVVDVVPKVVAEWLLRPALAVAPQVSLVCREGTGRRLLASLAEHELDVVIADAPADEWPSSTRVFSHMLGSSGLSFLGTREYAPRRRRFPDSLEGCPLLMPPEESAMRRAIERWLSRRRLTPTIAAEFDDSALLHAFGQRGLGVFAVPTAIERELTRATRLVVIGRTTDVEVAYYAISAERRLRHPAVAGLVESARSELFGG